MSARASGKVADYEREWDTSVAQTMWQMRVEADLADADFVTGSDCGVEPLRSLAPKIMPRFMRQVHYFTGGDRDRVTQVINLVGEWVDDCAERSELIDDTFRKEAVGKILVTLSRDYNRMYGDTLIDYNRMYGADDDAEATWDDDNIQFDTIDLLDTYARAGAADIGANGAGRRGTVARRVTDGVVDVVWSNRSPYAQFIIVFILLMLVHMIILRSIASHAVNVFGVTNGIVLTVARFAESGSEYGRQQIRRVAGHQAPVLYWSVRMLQHFGFVGQLDTNRYFTMTGRHLAIMADTEQVEYETWSRRIYAFGTFLSAVSLFSLVAAVRRYRSVRRRRLILSSNISSGMILGGVGNAHYEDDNDALDIGAAPVHANSDQALPMRDRLAFIYGTLHTRLKQDANLTYVRREIFAAAAESRATEAVPGRSAPPTGAQLRSIMDALNEGEERIITGIRAFSIDPFSRRKLLLALARSSDHHAKLVGRAMGVPEIDMRQVHDNLVGHLRRASEQATVDDHVARERRRLLRMGDVVLSMMIQAAPGLRSGSNNGGGAISDQEFASIGGHVEEWMKFLTDPNAWKIVLLAALMQIEWLLIMATFAVGNAGACAPLALPDEAESVAPSETPPSYSWASFSNWFAANAPPAVTAGLRVGADAAVMANPDSEQSMNLGFALDAGADIVEHIGQIPAACAGVHHTVHWLWWSTSHAAMIHFLVETAFFFGMSAIVYNAYFAETPSIEEASESTVVGRVRVASLEEAQKSEEAAQQRRLQWRAEETEKENERERRRREGKGEGDGGDGGGGSGTGVRFLGSSSTTTASPSSRGGGGGGGSPIIESCSICGQLAPYRCGDCKATYYCSKMCQESSWARGHLTTCTPRA